MTEMNMACTFCGHVGDAQCHCLEVYDVDMESLPKKKVSPINTSFIEEELPETATEDSEDSVDDDDNDQ